MEAVEHPSWASPVSGEAAAEPPPAKRSKQPREGDEVRIEPTLLHLTSNAWARWVTQSYMNAANDPTLNVQLPVGTRTTVWDRGIQGENQIVGVGDSGLAVKNCQFVDPGRPVGLPSAAPLWRLPGLARAAPDVGQQPSADAESRGGLCLSGRCDRRFGAQQRGDRGRRGSCQDG